MDEHKLTPSERNRLIELHFDQIEIASECEENDNWDDAGNAYFEAAKIAEKDLGEYDRASNHYLNAGNSYRKTRSGQAYESYNKSIDAYIKSGEIGEAITLSVRCGYIFKKEFGETEKSEEFYAKSVDLRRTHNLDHTCLYTQEHAQNFVDDVSKELNENINNIPYVIHLQKKAMEDATICRKCVHFGEFLSDYMQENEDLGDLGQIEWVKDNHDKFKAKLRETIAYFENLYVLSKCAHSENE
ncbi:Beta-soluble NSF attachment protein [Thelohanellus kitauei]|uniref:Beta-soluble NSF attachment protein n=1 Tax=Thelohanellus kitauei TaxID=669202 RepID=A0A0C2III4_THEKT|nr:Beta-soluble NSF attachment protein [Thelohanellus kitauei]